MPGTQLIRTYHLPGETVTLSLLTQISIPRHLDTTDSCQGPTPQYCHLCPQRIKPAHMISPSVGESDKAKGLLTSRYFVSTSHRMGERLAEAPSSGSPPAQGGGGRCLTGAPQQGRVSIDRLEGGAGFRQTLSAALSLAGTSSGLQQGRFQFGETWAR